MVGGGKFFKMKEPNEETKLDWCGALTTNRESLFTLLLPMLLRIAISRSPVKS